MEKDHGRAVRRFLAARMRHAAADLPDLVQEVFLRLLRVPDHEAIRNPRAYLYTIASHVLHQYTVHRAMSTQVATTMNIDAELEAALDCDPAETEQLSPRAYAALIMYRCEGATLEEIGRRFGVSRVMARKYLMKAITYCQQQLDETRQGRL